MINIFIYHHPPLSNYFICNQNFEEICTKFKDNFSFKWY